jgi:hypothetical protein
MMSVMKRAFAILSLLCFSLRAETNAPLPPDLENQRLRLEVEKAKLDAERAKFETEKARWDAERAAIVPPAAPSLSPIVIITNAPPEPLYIARESVRLYRRGQLAGDLAAGAIVSGTPSAQYRGWLSVKFNGATYDAEAKYFGNAQAILAEAQQRVAMAKARRDEVVKQIAELQTRQSRLEQQITSLEASRQQTVIVVPPSQPAANATNQQPVLVFGSDPAASQVMHLRSAMRQAGRDQDKLEKQLPALTQELGRAEAYLRKIQPQLDAARAASP